MAGGCSCGRKNCGKSAGKHPRTTTGLKEASKDPAQVAEWLGWWPAANIGIATGAVSGVDVLDIDGELGLSSLDALTKEHGQLPVTVTARSGSGGQHYYFKHGGLPTRSGVAPGIDTRGDGGYILAPSSKHRSGGVYRWEPGHGPFEIGLAPAPQWLIDVCTSKTSPALPLVVGDDEILWEPPERDQISLREIRARLQSTKGKWAEACTRALSGKPLFSPGAHRDNLYAFIAWLRNRLPEVTDETIISVLEPAIDAMQEVDSACGHDVDYCRQLLVDATERAIHIKSEAERLNREMAGLFDEGSTSGTPWLPARGYDISNGGVYKLSGEKRTLIASAPINVCETGRDEGGSTYVTLKYLHGPAERTVTLPRLEASGSALQSLAAYGAPINAANCSKVAAFLQAQEHESFSNIPSVSVFTRSGWSADYASYVLGDTVIGKPGRTLHKLGDADYAAAFKAKGDARAYKDFVTSIRDHSPVAEMIWAAGFAGSLLRPLSLRSPVLSIWGQSGTGKSALQALSVSPWGSPAKQMLNANVSAAGLGLELARRSDLPTWIDDTQNLPSDKLFDTLAYEVGTGRSGTRATQTGDLRTAKNWLTLVIVSGERPLQNTGVAAGAKNRTIELHAKSLGDSALAKSVHQFLANHHGHTGPTFIKALQENYLTNGRGQDLKDIYLGFCKDISAEGTERSSQIALLVTASYLARTIAFDEDGPTARTKALDAGRSVLETATESDSDLITTQDNAYNLICSFVAQHGHRFTDTTPGLFDNETQERFGTFEEQNSQRVAVILATVMNRIAKENGFALRQVTKQLRDDGLLLVGSDGRNDKLVTFGGKRVRAYCVVLPDVN